MDRNSNVIAGGPTPKNRPPFITQGYTLKNAPDVVSIQQLLSRYCHLLDSDTSEIRGIVELFHPDAEIIAAYEGDKVHRGHDAISSWYANYLALSRKGSKLRRHLISTTRIEVNEDKGWAFSMLDAQGIQLEKNQPWFYAGSYEDDLVKTGNRWFFKRRRISLDYAWNALSYELCRNGKQVWNGEEEK